MLNHKVLLIKKWRVIFAGFMSSWDGTQRNRWSMSEKTDSFFKKVWVWRVTPDKNTYPYLACHAHRTRNRPCTIEPNPTQPNPIMVPLFNLRVFCRRLFTFCFDDQKWPDNKRFCEPASAPRTIPFILFLSNFFNSRNYRKCYIR